MLNLTEYNAIAPTGDQPRRYFNYEGFFGGVFQRDGFGLQGAGSLSLDTPQTRINLIGETPLPMLITLSLTFIPIVGRAIRTFYRPQGDFAFQFADISEIVRKGARLQFKAPKRAGAKPARVEFQAKTEAEAEQIESCIRHYKSDVTPGRYVSGLRFVKYAAGAAAFAFAIFLLFLVGAAIIGYAEKPADVYVTVSKEISGKLYRKPVNRLSEMKEFPEAANGILKRGGSVFLVAAVSPEGTVTDVRIKEKRKGDGFPSTDNPILIEAAINSARQIRYEPDKEESRIELWYHYQTRLDRALSSF